ncbi:MAG: hypothetical protein GC192_03135 [Bacteroidetes bacterium]|nr:hypothetical protein [Bacteroidota bacterium]
MKAVQFTLSIIGFVAGLYAVYFMVLTGIFTIVSRSANDHTNYSNIDMGIIITILLLVWFVIIQAINSWRLFRGMMNK